MELSADILASVTNNVSKNDYKSAYQAIASYLHATYPDATGADADTIHWFDVAYQENSGAQTFDPVAIRAINAVGSDWELGQTIDLFGSQEGDSSNAIAQAVLQKIIAGNGQLPSFQTIYQTDASVGMAVSAEIKTGRRRVTSYLLDPVVQHVDDSFRER